MNSADEMKCKGVDEIICISVNDAYVMAAWAQNQNAEGKVIIFFNYSLCVLINLSFFFFLN